MRDRVKAIAATAALRAVCAIFVTAQALAFTAGCGKSASVNRSNAPAGATGGATGTIVPEGGSDVAASDGELRGDAGADTAVTDARVDVAASDGELRGDAGADTSVSDARVDVIPTCTTAPGDHGAACGDAGCAIVEDVVLSCNDTFVASNGVRVAPGSEATWLAASSDSRPLVFRIAAGQATLQDEIPSSYAGRMITLAVSPSGEPWLAASFDDSTESADGAAQTLSRVESATHGPTGWTRSVVTNQSYMVTDAEYGPGGVPHLFLWDGSFWHATPSATGLWSIASTPVIMPQTGGWNRFSLASDGSPAAFDTRPAAPAAAVGFSDSVHVIVGTTERQLSARFVGSSFAYSVAPALSPPGSSSSKVLVAAAIQTDDGIRVASLDAQGYRETPLPNSAGPWTSTCGPTPTDLICTGPPCRDTTVRIENGAFAFAQTSDSVGWLAYVVTHSDVTEHYGLVPTSPSGQWCVLVVDADNSHSDLRLARVPLDGTPPTDVLTFPIATLLDTRWSGVSPPHEASFMEYDPPKRSVDLRAFGSDLAIGLKTAGTNGTVGLRAVRIDTTRF